MRIGLFTDTYFPQVSGLRPVSNLKTELEKAMQFLSLQQQIKMWTATRIGKLFEFEVPLFAFKDRRFAYRGFTKALEIAKQYQLDIIHIPRQNFHLDY